MKILVTGATGFVGSNFINNLIIERKESEFYLISRNNFENINSNVKIIRSSLFDFSLIENYIKKTHN